MLLGRKRAGTNRDRILARCADRDRSKRDGRDLRLYRRYLGARTFIGNLHEGPASEIYSERKTQKGDGTNRDRENDSGDPEEERAMTDNVHN